MANRARERKQREMAQKKRDRIGGRGRTEGTYNASKILHLLHTSTEFSAAIHLSAHPFTDIFSLVNVTIVPRRGGGGALHTQKGAQADKRNTTLLKTTDKGASTP